MCHRVIGTKAEFYIFKSSYISIKSPTSEATRTVLKSWHLTFSLLSYISFFFNLQSTIKASAGMCFPTINKTLNT